MNAATLVAVVLGSIAGYHLVRALHAERSDWTLSSWFVFGLAWLLNAPAAVAKLTGTYTRTTDLAGRDLILYGGVAQKLQSSLYVLIIALCVVTGTVRLFRRGLRTPVWGAPLLVALAVFIGSYSAQLDGFEFLPGRVVALLAIVLAVVVLQPGKGVALGAATFGVTLGLASALVTVVDYTLAMAPAAECARKCGEIGLLFAGAANHGNGLGLALVLALPFVLLAFTGRSRLVLAGFLLVLIVATGSRSAIAASGVVVVAALICRPGYGPEGRTQGRNRKTLLILLVAGVVTGFVLPFVVDTRGAFTNRGYLWMIAREEIAARPWLGAGSEAWAHAYQTGAFGAAAGYSTHNQWIDVLYVGGMVALGLVGVATLLLLARAEGLHSWAALFILLTIAWMGVLERVVSLNGIDWMVWALPAALLVNPMTVKRLTTGDQVSAVYFQAPPTRM